MAVVSIEEGFRLVLPEEVRADLQVGDEVIVVRDREGRITIAPTSRRGDLTPAELLERLQETFGLWADRDDIPNDGVAYVDAIRTGTRLDEASRH